MRSTTIRAAVGILVATVSSVLAVGAVPVAAPADTTPPGLRINQIQVVGSHNSYKIEASPEESAIRRSFIGDGENLMQYGHVPLPEQFATQDVRQIELDVFRDDAGGKYANPLIRGVAGHGPYDPAMNEPGTKVLHVQDVDYRSTCLKLVDCLAAVEAWSDANPSHLPIAVLMELKDDALEIGDIEFTLPDPWTADAMDALDEEILSVVPRDEIITPDDVRGDHDTLDEAVTGDGWPTVDESRGKLMFLMDNGGRYRTDYLDGHPVLEGRVMFTNANPGDPDAAFVKRNEPRGNEAEIQGLVEDGYVVRTRADADTIEARTGDTTGRDAAFASGAQWVSTDYPVPEYAERFGTDYVVQIPGGGVARCNPVNAPVGCVDDTIEPVVTTSPDGYVAFLYDTFLGRPGTEAERSTWVDRLDRGTPPVQVARMIARSAEANRGPNLEPAYDGYLGRAPDAASRDYWSGRLAGGLSVGRLTITVAASDEAFARSGATNASWVEQLYQVALGRPADAPGLDHFVARLDSGQPRWRIAREVIFSAEGRRRIVSEATEEVLGRRATSSELQGYGDLIRSTLDPLRVRIDLAASPEVVPS